MKHRKSVTLDDITHVLRDALLGNETRRNYTIIGTMVCCMLALTVPKSDALFVQLWAFNVAITIAVIYKIKEIKNR